MSIREVRSRAEEFEQAETQYKQWPTVRHSNRDHPPDGHELEGYAPEVQSGHPAKRWRRLEQEMRRCEVWEASGLPTHEQIRWAKRLNALSESLQRPQTRRLDTTPAPQVRDYES